MLQILPVKSQLLTFLTSLVKSPALCLTCSCGLGFTTWSLFKMVLLQLPFHIKTHNTHTHTHTHTHTYTPGDPTLLSPLYLSFVLVCLFCLSCRHFITFCLLTSWPLMCPFVCLSVRLSIVSWQAQCVEIMFLWLRIPLWFPLGIWGTPSSPF